MGIVANIAGAGRSIRRALLLAASLPLIGASVAQAADLTIGVINPITGPGADLGISAHQGMDPYIEELNRAGGINGMQVKLVYRDDESNPQKAVAAFYELVERQQIDLLMGTNLTNVAFAVTPLANQAKIPFLDFGTGSGLVDPAKFPYSFRNNMTTALEGNALVEVVMKLHQFKAPGLLVDPTAYGQSGEAALRAAMQKYNVAPATVQTFAMADTDMSAQFVAMQKANVDVTFVWGLGTMLAHAARSAERVGYAPPVFGSLGMHQQGFVDLAGSAGAKWSASIFRSVTRSATEPAPADMRTFIAKEQSVYGDKLSKSVMVVALYNDGIRLLLDAVKRAGSKNREAVRDALLKTTDFKGLLSTYSFGPGKQDGYDPRDVTIAYALDVQDGIRLRVPGAP